MAKSKVLKVIAYVIGGLFVLAIVGLGGLYTVDYFWGPYIVIKTKATLPQLYLVPDEEKLTISKPAEGENDLLFHFAGYSFTIDPTNISLAWPNMNFKDDSVNAIVMGIENTDLELSFRQKTDFDAPQILEEITEEVSKTYSAKIKKSAFAMRKFENAYSSTYVYYKNLFHASPNQARLFAEKMDSILLCMFLMQKQLEAPSGEKSWIKEFVAPHTKGFWCRSLSDTGRGYDRLYFFEGDNRLFTFYVSWPSVDNKTLDIAEEYVKRILGSISFGVSDKSTLFSRCKNFNPRSNPVVVLLRLTQLIALNDQPSQKLCGQLAMQLNQFPKEKQNRFISWYNHKYASKAKETDRQ